MSISRNNTGTIRTEEEEFHGHTNGITFGQIIILIYRTDHDEW